MTSLRCVNTLIKELEALRFSIAKWRCWLEKRGTGDVPAKRPGVTINRRDLIAVPVPVANLLWQDRHVRSGRREKGWVLYLEGSTDLAILLALARRLEHPAADLLENPYVHYVANQPRKAQEHFYGVREAQADLVGIAVYDRLPQVPPSDPHLTQLMWRRRELESYLVDGRHSSISPMLKGGV
jgi:hypothetical protein